MYRAGIPLLVGSDSQGSIATFPGAIHEELQLLVEAGVPAADVLYAATRGNALFLDANADYGAVEPGRAADLLLVEGDPTVDIRHTEDIVQVFVGGVPVRPTGPPSAASPH
jgi:imidazolonepropionase-like amidohydrolase